MALRSYLTYTRIQDVRNVRNVRNPPRKLWRGNCMQYLHFEHIQTLVSKIALGTTYFGTSIDSHTAHTMLDYFVSQGGTTIDTARLYGQSYPGGPSLSEQTIGRWITLNNMRKHIVLVTKGLASEPSGASRYSYKNLMLDIDRSQQELQTDYFDVWFLHRDDPSVPVDEVMDMVAPLVESGVIQTLGASNWTTERINLANTYAQKHNLPQFEASEIHWSLAQSTPESWQDTSLVCMSESELAWYRKHQMPIFAYASQAKGFFSKAIAHGLEGLNTKSRNRFLQPENIARLERVKRLSQELHVSPAAIAVGYITHEQPPSVALVGCSSLPQLADTLTGSDLYLNPRQISYLLGVGEEESNNAT